MGLHHALDRLAALAERHGNLRYAGAAMSVAPAPDTAQPVHVVAEAPQEQPASVITGLDVVLYSPSEGAASRPLLSILMPPPPETSDPTAVRAWLAGKVHHPLAPALAPINAPIEEQIEAEVEALGHETQGYTAMAARAPCDPMAGAADAAWLQELPPPEVQPDPRTAADAFARGVREVLERFEPETAATLHAYGARLRISPELAALLARAQAIEADWLSGGPAGGGQPQDLRGAVSSSADLHEPTILRRTAFLHILTSRPIACALRDALVETRHAQACARVPDAWIAPGEIEHLLPSAPPKEPVEDLLERLATSLLITADRPAASPDPQDLFARFALDSGWRQREDGLLPVQAAREAIRALSKAFGLSPKKLVRAWIISPKVSPALWAMGLKISI